SEDKDWQPLAALAAAALPKTLQQKILAISDLNELAVRLAEEKSVTDVVDLLCEHYELDREDPELIRFRQMATSSPSLPAFAEHLRRHQDSLIYDDRAEAVLLATLHAAKGLEFRAVFMVGCEEGLLPLTPRGELSLEAEQEHIQEERRLFFVGMTRAAEVLYLTGAKERLGFAGLEQRTPSRFLSEIPPELLQNPLTVQKQRKKRAGKQLSLF
ncbi:MAG: ATP-dependent helicase, partial [Candidatus Electrothrix sp. AX5]|nr:ATP-dependent helicase [Candidatus Electrothrix sp. AX5]